MSEWTPSEKRRRINDALEAIAHRASWTEDEALQRRTRCIPDHCKAIRAEVDIIHRLLGRAVRP